MASGLQARCDVMELLLVGLVSGILLGYIAGRLDRLVSVRPEENSFFTSTTQRRGEAPKKKVAIDETKFVTDVSTEDMKSAGNAQLGTVTTAKDDISAATNKLAHLKKSKGY